ncbi:MAG TPA: GGDEF domain-containing protein [Candidatus Sulfotelmatobacter sp.]
MGSPLQPLRKWTVVVCAVVGVHVVLSLVAPRNFALTAFGDILQSFLLLCGTVAMLSNVKSSRRKARFFWSLMGLGFGMWLSAQLLWTYFEVILRQEVPNPFIGDVILFLHIVPMMAAVAVRPHIQQNERSARVVSLDFTLLLIWWLYLYLFIVIPWQYLSPSLSLYGTNFDVVYGSEQVVLVFVLGLAWWRGKGKWKSIYGQFFGAASVYCLGSILASEAIDRGAYYTGSLFDVPLVGAMTCFAAIGFISRKSPPENAAKLGSEAYAIWNARLAMLAVFLTPLMVLWAEFGGRDVPPRVRTYRVLLTVAIMIAMGCLVFFRQHLLDQELLELLQTSRQNLDEMRAMKNELEIKEQSLRWHTLELQRKNLELQEISFTDVLTGVWNRRYLEEILASEAGQVLRNYQRAWKSGGGKMDHRDLVFLMVDVDFFKQVNDQHGHPAGDRLLKLVAQRLGSVVRRSDVLVRWGGEEFLIMTRSSDPSDTPIFCERILEVIGAEPFELGHGVRVRKTCSVGWAPYPWCREAFEAMCAEEVIALADTALYQAKGFGRNQGVGVLPAAPAGLTFGAAKFYTMQADGGDLVRIMRTPYPETKQLADLPTSSSLTPVQAEKLQIFENKV